MEYCSHFRLQTERYKGLLCSGQDPEDFQMAYDMMMQYISNEENWTDMEIELKGRGVSTFIEMKLSGRASRATLHGHVHVVVVAIIVELTCPPPAKTAYSSNHQTTKPLLCWFEDPSGGASRWSRRSRPFLTFWDVRPRCASVGCVIQWASRDHPHGLHGDWASCCFWFVWQKQNTWWCFAGERTELLWRRYWLHIVWCIWWSWKSSVIRNVRCAEPMAVQWIQGNGQWRLCCVSWQLQGTVLCRAEQFHLAEAIRCAMFRCHSSQALSTAVWSVLKAKRRMLRVRSPVSRALWIHWNIFQMLCSPNILFMGNFFLF